MCIVYTDCRAETLFTCRTSARAGWTLQERLARTGSLSPRSSSRTGGPPSAVSDDPLPVCLSTAAATARCMFSNDISLQWAKFSTRVLLPPMIAEAPIRSAAGCKRTANRGAQSLTLLRRWTSGHSGTIRPRSPSATPTPAISPTSSRMRRSVRLTLCGIDLSHILDAAEAGLLCLAPR